MSIFGKFRIYKNSKKFNISSFAYNFTTYYKKYIFWYYSVRKVKRKCGASSPAKQFAIYRPREINFRKIQYNIIRKNTHTHKNAHFTTMRLWIVKRKSTSCRLFSPRVHYIYNFLPFLSRFIFFPDNFANKYREIRDSDYRFYIRSHYSDLAHNRP